MEKLVGANFVYFLRDPRDNAVRYIGITRNPKVRFFDHWAQRLYRDGNCTVRNEKIVWMRELDRCGLRPVMDVVLSGLDRRQAERVEHNLVSKWNDAYPGQLLQGRVSFFDPIKPLSVLWDRCDERQREAMLQFMQDRMCLVKVAS